MEKVFDLHLHSRFSRGTSPSLRVGELAKWAKIKGIDVLTTGDFTHPLWRTELTQELKDKGGGFLEHKDFPGVYFMVGGEISCIYFKNGKTRKIHLVVFLPSLLSAEKVSDRLEGFGKLSSDGRPIFGEDVSKIMKVILETEPKAIFLPAHVWTPWFSLYGSNSGFDSLYECFGGMSEEIHAIETGLSSDPPLNWRLPELDNRLILSFSDAHSGQNLMREATVLEMDELSYNEFLKILKNRDESKIVKTIEFFPEEGKYHFDGHRNCDVRVNPTTKEKNPQNICPKCQKPLTIGVLNRVEKLAKRPSNFKPEGRPPFIRLVGLEKIIAEALGQKPGTKEVEKIYHLLIAEFDNELKVLTEVLPEDLEKIAHPKIAEGLRQVRNEKLKIVPGYDGVFGEIKIFEEEVSAQATLF